MPFPDTKLLHQFVAQFACRIPIRKQLLPAEKKALENVLRDMDPDFFQLFEDPTTSSVSSLYQVSRQYVLGASTVTMPSFIFSNNSVTLLYPVKIAGNYISRDRKLETSEQNKKMADRLFAIQNAFKNLKYQRAGKIFELVLGPFHKEDKKKLFGKLFSLGLEEIGEINLTFAKHQEHNSSIYNLQTIINYQQSTLEDSFHIAIRVDINNRQLVDSLEPSQVLGIWNLADSAIWDHLENTIVIEHT